MCERVMCINMLDALCSFSFNCFRLLCFGIVVFAISVILLQIRLVRCALIVYLQQPTIPTIILLTLFIRCALHSTPLFAAHLLSVSHSLESTLPFTFESCSTATINIMNTMQTHAYIDFNYMFSHNRNDCMICIKNSHSAVIAHCVCHK